MSVRRFQHQYRYVAEIRHLHYFPPRFVWYVSPWCCRVTVKVVVDLLVPNLSIIVWIQFQIKSLRFVTDFVP